MLLNINRPTFLTDNQILAKAAASWRLDHPLLHWNTRHTMASFFDISATLAPQVFHIKRDLNGVAHDCAHQVLRQSLSQPIFSCICPAHSSPTCPAISTLENFVCQDFVINAVWCVWDEWNWRLRRLSLFKKKTYQKWWHSMIDHCLVSYAISFVSTASVY
jgi:hypothetical protein